MFLFRKLIIAVLALGLVFSFGSTVLAKQLPSGKVLGEAFQANPNAPLGAGNEIARNLPPFQKPFSDLDALTPSITVAVPNGVCDDIDYSGGSAYYYWDIPNVYGTTNFSQRFTPDGACTLTAVYAAFDFDQTVGAPDLDLYIYGDDGFGYPDAGNMIDHITILNADLPTTGMGYFGVSGLEHLFADGEEFHIAWGISGDPSGAMVGFSDDGASGDMRSCEFWNSTWGLMLDNWSLDVNFLMLASVCYEDAGGLPDDCYWNSPACDLAYTWRIPHPNGHMYYFQRFDVEGPETLKTIAFPFYGAGAYAHACTESRVLVCGMDGFGYPDTTNIIFETTILLADAQLYPNYNEIDVSSLSPVFTTSFYVVVTPAAGATGYLNVLSSSNACGSGWGGMDFDGGTGAEWYFFGELYTTGYLHMLFEVELCRDVYAECHWESYYGGLAYFYGLPSTYGEVAFGSKISASLGGCDMVEIDAYFYNNGAATYAGNAEVAVYASDGVDGLPGTQLLSIPLSAPSIPTGWNFFDVAGQLFYDADVWLVIESFSATTTDIQVIIDDGTTPTGRAAVSYGGSWIYMVDDPGWGADYDPVIDAYVCCVPQEGHNCALGAGEEWPTLGKTFARENYSYNGIGGIGTADDARCYLTKDWDYVGPNNALYNSPVLLDGKLVVVMTNHVICLDASTGAQLWDRPADNIYLGTSSRCTPTIHNGLVYVSGGDAQGFNAIDMADGSFEWQVFTNGFGVYGPSVIINVGGTDVVFTSDDLGGVYAFNAATGANFFATNPFFTATGFIHKAVTTDGDYLYVGCDAFAGQPNLYKIDVATGTVVLDFVVDGDGFQLPNLHSNEASIEGIYHAMAYEDGFIYFATSYAPQNLNPVTNGGLMYKVDVSDFTIEWQAEANGSVSGAPGGVVLDLASVYFGGWSNWINGGSIWGPTSYNKNTGTINWTQTTTNPTIYQHALSAALLTCETLDDPAVPDWLIWGTSDWYLNFTETTLGEQVFHRRYEFASAMYNAAIMNDEYLFVGSLDFVAAMKNQATARPRLELPENMEVRVSVEFGLGPSVNVAFPDVIYNNGCADLTINGITLDAVDNGTFPLAAFSSVSPNRNAEMNAMADQMAGKYVELIETMSSDLSEHLKKEKASSFNRASFAPPVWVNGVTSPTAGATVTPGSYEDIVVNIDGTQLPRGYNPFYAFVDTDDPDYFLDHAYIDDNLDYGVPSVKLAVIGGCLLNFTELHFGAGGANYTTVYNTTLISRGASYDGGVLIDGDNDNVYVNDGYVFTWNDIYHVAMNWDDPFSNVEYQWKSILPDPLIGDDCAFTSGTALLAKMWDDIAGDYEDIYGTIINYAYVDSIQDMRNGGDFTTWIWDYGWYNGGTLGEPSYNDSLTEGFAFRGVVSEYGIVDVPEFANFTISRHALYSRYGYAIDDVYMGVYTDYDIGDYNRNRGAYNATYSLAWMYDRLVDEEGWGYVKIPFGLGYEPMKNSISTTYAAFLQDPEPNFDSLHVWMSTRTGLFEMSGNTDADRRLFATMGSLDLPAWGWTPSTPADHIPADGIAEIGVVQFGYMDLTTMTDPMEYAPMALLVNKFCGFGRGDVNNDGNMNLIDIVYLNAFKFGGGDGPKPFEHLGDVNGDSDVNVLDILYLIDWYFQGGPAPVGEWALPRSSIALP